MADIVLTSLYEQKEGEFGTKGAGLTRFKKDFVTATNRAIYQMNHDADLENAISDVTDTDDTVTNCDVKYEYVLSWGISLHLLYMGRRPPKGAEALIKQAKEEFEDGIQRMMDNLRNDLQDADTNDDTTDIIGHGALG